MTSIPREHSEEMSAKDSISALVKSRESRTNLLKLSSDLGAADDPKLRGALHEDERRLAAHIIFILESESSKERVLKLDGDPAQYFLDVVQNRTAAGKRPKSKARRIILKLSEACDKLPSSLFITGVTGRDEHATFGGGFGDIYQASYAGKTVALKLVRTFHGRETRLLSEIAQGLEYLHSREIVHGDLRGANILINAEWSACLADFDLTSFSDATTTALSSNRAGSVRWMAPELLDPGHFDHNQFSRTPASDVYAFGCVCLELYTGRPPFTEISEPAAILRVIDDGRSLKPSGDPAISEDLWHFLSECWTEDSAARPATHVVAQILN
ncbi:kinase-like domain-containing protein [Mycena rebaudengoi]|nr:kinase-like domain-containing protein [Mycena rebaudengoi]